MMIINLEMNVFVIVRVPTPPYRSTNADLNCVHFYIISIETNNSVYT